MASTEKGNIVMLGVCQGRHQNRDEILKVLLLCIFTTDMTHLWDIFQ